jgi:hypothetical protein
MNVIIITFFFFFLLHYETQISVCKNFDKSDEIAFAVVLTTIPPRFPHLTTTILSWLEQDLPPVRICIYVPRQYKRFRRKQNLKMGISFLHYLESKLSKQSTRLSEALNKSVVKLVDASEDYGAITRFSGLINEQIFWSKAPPNISSTCFNRFTEELPHFWLISDDDVKYAQFTTTKYFHGILHFNQQHKVERSFGLTQFSEDYRMVYQDSESNLHAVPHVQGVDTYIVPQEYLMLQYCTFDVLHYLHVNAAINFFHDVCPEAFFHDDYIVSFLLHLAGLKVWSIWNYDNLAGHIEGVSKSNFQMHMSADVFEKEESVKKCVSTYATQIILLTRHPSDKTIHPDVCDVTTYLLK